MSLQRGFSLATHASARVAIAAAFVVVPVSAAADEGVGTSESSVSRVQPPDAAESDGDPGGGHGGAIDGADGSTMSAASEDTPSNYAVTAGLDLYTRFLYRGVAFGDQWTLQPNASISSHGFTGSLWASAGLDQRSLRDYVGITASYYASGRLGTIGIDVSDWIFTSHTVCRTRDTVDPTVCLVTDIDFNRSFIGNFANDGTGAHWLDLTLSYQGPSAFPMKVQLGVVAYGDPDFSKYLGLSYPIDLGHEFTLTPELGMVFGRSAFWYWTDSDPVNVTNCAVTVSKNLMLGRGIRMPLSILGVVNPEAGRIQIVAGVGLRI